MTRVGWGDSYNIGWCFWEKYMTRVGWGDSYNNGWCIWEKLVGLVGVCFFYSFVIGGVGGGVFFLFV